LVKEELTKPLGMCYIGEELTKPLGMCYIGEGKLTKLSIMMDDNDG